MKKQARIEQLQQEIEKLKQAKEDTDVQFTLDAIDEEIEERETEIIKIEDGDIIVDEAEYQEQARARLDTLEDLDNSQI
jgi:hypothetical protein